MKNFGLATVGVVRIKNDIIETDDFQAGKKGDFVAAGRIVDLIWKQTKTDQLSEKVTEKTVFVSMPSTTKLNVIPIQLAAKIAELVNKPYIAGDDFFNTAHAIASKNIPRDKRVFSQREYAPVDTEKINQLLGGKDIIIVDDIITTGGSIRNFTEFLESINLNVNHVVGLMGDRRLVLDDVTKNKLNAMMVNKGVNVDINNIAHLTRMEAGGLLRRLNGLRGENGIKKFAEDIRGLQRKGIVANSGRDTRAGWNNSLQGKDNSNEQLGERIPTYSSSPKSQEQLMGTMKNEREVVKQQYVDELEKLSIGVSSRAEMLFLAADITTWNQEQKKVKHLEIKPTAPTGLLRGFKISTYNKELKEWQKVDTQLNKRLDSLNAREDYLEKIMKNPKEAEKIALTRLVKQKPELVKNYRVIRTEERAEKMQEKRARMVAKRINNDKDKGLGR